MIGLIIDSILRGTRKLDDISKIYGLKETILINMLREIEGITVSEREIVINNKIQLVLSAIKKGISPRLLSRHLSWKEFEEEVSRILEAHNYDVYTNVFVKGKKRWQIDVVGITNNKIVMIDCKHWNKMSNSQILKASSLHYERTLDVIKNTKLIELSLKSRFREGVVVPVIVSLASSKRGLMNNVFIVPIQYFESFLRDVDSLIEDTQKITYSIKSLENYKKQ